MKTTPPLKKICSQCGQEKPLSAFLRLRDANGTTYDSICASCRKKMAGETTTQQKDDDSQQTTVGGARIRNTEKNARQQTNTQQTKKIADLYYTGRDTKSTHDITKHAETNTLIENAKRRSRFFQQNPALTQTTRQTATPAAPTKETEAISSSDMQIPKESLLKGEAIAKYAALLGEASPLARKLGKSPLARLFEKSQEKLTRQIASTEKTEANNKNPLTNQIDKYWRNPRKK